MYILLFNTYIAQEKAKKKKTGRGLKLYITSGIFGKHLFLWNVWFTYMTSQKKTLICASQKKSFFGFSKIYKMDSQTYNFFSFGFRFFFFVAELNKNPVEGFSAGLIDESDIHKWEVLIIGPPDTL